MRALAILLAAVAASTCGPQPSPNPQPGPVPTLGGSPATGGASAAGGLSSGGVAGDAPAPAATACEAAQWALDALRCPEAKTPAGTSFVVACERAKADGRDWHPACIAKISTCSQVAAAYRGEYCP